MLPKVLILHADGTNRDLEAAQAFSLAGAQPEIVHLNQLRAREKCWADYQILVLPGGFSYADTLGAGRLLALDLKTYFADEAREFISRGKPVIGICNGFQALVKAGFLPASEQQSQSATLTFNADGHFECRWVTLAPQSRKCLWTRGLAEPIECPVAHGEGNFVLRDPGMLGTLLANDQIALTYVQPAGSPAQGEYPFNPNGSIDDIAGICNPQGNVLGLMPHPEDHVFGYQHPRWARGERGGMGLTLFENGVRFAAQM
jgi:phosphoribosylformylglycinamidine synthase subunit PurQ / glutaminase